MRLYLIGCEVIQRELCDAIVRSPHVVSARFLSKGLHDLGARAMRVGIQEAIDAVPAGSHDAIVLGYGLCGNGLAGVTARDVPLVLPRAHDCITLLMGDRQRFASYFQDHPGAYYRSSGWIERAGDMEPMARDRTGAGFTLESLIEKYGEDNGRYLHEELTRYRRSYTRLTFIETGIEPTPAFAERARDEAARRGWEFESLRGDLGLFHRLLAGDWDARDFLVVSPGARIAARAGDAIVSTEEGTA